MRSSIGGTPDAHRSVQYNKYERRHATAKKNGPATFVRGAEREELSWYVATAALDQVVASRSSYFDPSPIIAGSNSIIGCPAPHIFALRSQLSARSPSLTKS
jgi:hypothetical protein